MNKKEMLEKIKETIRTQNADPNYDIDYNQILNNENLVATLIDQYGGEGRGEELYVIMSLIDKKTSETILMFKVDGSYESWEGSDWSYARVYEVKPKQVMVTKYVKVE